MWALVLSFLLLTSTVFANPVQDIIDGCVSSDCEYTLCGTYDFSIDASVQEQIVIEGKNKVTLKTCDEETEILVNGDLSENWYPIFVLRNVNEFYGSTPLKIIFSDTCDENCGTNRDPIVLISDNVQKAYFKDWHVRAESTQNRPRTFYINGEDAGVVNAKNITLDHVLLEGTGRLLESQYGDNVTLKDSVLQGINPNGTNSYLHFSDGVLKYKGDGFKAIRNKIYALNPDPSHTMAAVRFLDDWNNPTADPNVLATFLDNDIYVSGIDPDTIGFIFQGYNCADISHNTIRCLDEPCYARGFSFYDDGNCTECNRNNIVSSNRIVGFSDLSQWSCPFYLGFSNEDNMENIFRDNQLILNNTAMGEDGFCGDDGQKLFNIISNDITYQ